MKLKKIIINLFLIVTIVGILMWMISKKEEDEEIEEKNNILLWNETQMAVQNLMRNNVEKVEKQYPKENVAQEYKGYIVEAKLEIPDIALETYILQENTEKALNTAVVKIYGATPNRVGNLCVAGHNAPYNTNMFRDLKDLEVGENLYVIDNEVGRVEYIIYDIYKVYPEDVSCLSQETNGEKEVTLITCTNDSTQRRIIKAREV